MMLRRNMLAALWPLAIIGAAKAQPTGVNTSNTPNGTAAGDLGGTYPNPSVLKLNGVAPTAYATAVVGQLPATSTNDAASAGNIGEYLNTSLASSGALVLTSTNATNVISLALTAGDWDVWGQGLFHPGAAVTVITLAQAGIGTASGTLPGVISGAQGQLSLGAGVTGAAGDLAVYTGIARVSFSSTSTAFLVADLTFGTSTAAAYGVLQARRRR